MDKTLPMTEPRSGFARPSYRPEPARGLDPELRRMGMVAGGIGALALVAFGTLSLFGGGHRHGDRVPVIAAEQGPVRIKPSDPGGMRVAGAEDSGPAGTTERLAPPPERPDLSELRTRSHAHADKPKTVAAAPQAVAPVPSVLHASATVPAPKPLPEFAAPKAAARAAPMFSVQLATLASEDAARAAWFELRSKHPEALKAETPRFVRATLGTHTVWQVRVGHFASAAAAHAFCGKFLADRQDCAVTAS